jgi:hypothetical protein
MTSGTASEIGRVIAKFDSASKFESTAYFLKLCVQHCISFLSMILSMDIYAWM